MMVTTIIKVRMNGSDPWLNSWSFPSTGLTNKSSPLFICDLPLEWLQEKVQRLINCCGKKSWRFRGCELCASRTPSPEPPEPGQERTAAGPSPGPHPALPRGQGPPSSTHGRMEVSLVLVNLYCFSDVVIFEGLPPSSVGKLGNIFASTPPCY